MIPLKLISKLKITSKYGERLHPITKKKDFHHGVDLTGGDEILATANGKVVQVVNKGKKGGTMCKIRIQHKDYQSAYYHNKSGSARATGVHLHFQIDKGSNATSINPTDYAKGKKELEGLLDLKLGKYIVISPRYVRYGAGTDYQIKKVKELTLDGQRHCVDQRENAKAQYKKGTIFTANKLLYAKNGAVWGCSPSGWVCIRSHKGEYYCKGKE